MILKKNDNLLANYWGGCSPPSPPGSYGPEPGEHIVIRLYIYMYIYSLYIYCFGTWGQYRAFCGRDETSVDEMKRGVPLTFSGHK